MSGFVEGDQTIIAMNTQGEEVVKQEGEGEVVKQGEGDKQEGEGEVVKQEEGDKQEGEVVKQGEGDKQEGEGEVVKQETVDSGNASGADATATSGTVITDAEIVTVDDTFIPDPTKKYYIVIGDKVFNYDADKKEKTDIEVPGDLALNLIATARSKSSTGGRRRSRRNRRQQSKRQSKKRQHKHQSKKRQQGGKKQRKSKKNQKQ